MKDFKKIKLLILDNDGVLTDGKVIYDNHRTESNIKNGKRTDCCLFEILKRT